ncbi:hypothetical protein [Streptomyces sp. NPDC051211]|uniref:hypothetical protein n=1 Tax=Streptomyces sp. NPDC051211 TaxID=3154643 RepID=UPI00344BDE9D
MVNSRLVKFGCPAAAVVAVAAVAFALAGPLGNQGPDEGVEGVGAAPVAVPQAFVGDQGNPATWRLPVEAYMPARTDARMVGSVRDRLIDECMKQAGYEKWQPAPDLPDLSGVSLTDRRYGIHDDQLTEERGYHPDAALQKDYEAAVAIGAVDKSGADPEAVRTCVQSADGKAPGVEVDALVQRIGNDSYRESLKDPAVVGVFAQWSVCMKGKGYTYKAPMEAVDNPRFGHSTNVTQEEIATARADLDCRKQYNLTRVWFDAEARIQQSKIKGNLTALNAVKESDRALIEKSAALSAPR